MRTPALKHLDRSISALNTHFALSNLFSEQFVAQNRIAIDKTPAKLTTAEFPKSDAARRIDIPLGKVENKIVEFDSFLLSQSIARCSENAKTYFEWIEKFNVETLGFNQIPSCLLYTSPSPRDRG